MEERLREAAQAGDTNALYACIRQDPDVFRRMDEAEFVDTPLHIASAKGHTDFAIAIMYLRPSFARKLNPDVFSPIHLALQNQHTQTVGRLLAVDKDLVRVKGKEGYTALHCVAESGTLDLLAQFLKDCPESFEDLTIRGETALHIAAQNNRLEALEILARWLRRSHLYGKVSRKHLLNSKDRDGNTVLHIAASNTQPQMIRVLLECKVDITEINASGFTALNIHDQNQTHSPNRGTSLCILRTVSRALNARTVTTARGRISSDSFFLTEPLHEKLRFTITFVEETWSKVINMSPDRINILLVVLALILTATYQASISPPGGVWQGDPTANSTSSDHYVGTSIMNQSSFEVFFLLNLVVFMLASLLTIALLQMVCTCSSNILIFMVELLLASLSCCVSVAWLVVQPVDPTNFQVKKDGRLGLLPITIILMLFLMEFSRSFFCLNVRPRFFTRFFREM